MDIGWCTLDDVGEETGTVVVIDVLRAFTTAAVGLDAGVASWEMVASPDEAYARREGRPGTVLVGEVGTRRAAGFDHGNSPVLLARAARDGGLAGAHVVHRSTAGTQGVVRATSARRVMTASFAVASATARALADDESVSMCVTGLVEDRDGDEDRAFGEYLAALLQDGPDVDPAPYLDRVAASDSAALFDLGHDDLPPEDVAFAQVVDRHDFAMEVRRDPDGRLLLEPVPSS